MLLPAQLGPASTWSVADYSQKWVLSKAAASGTATIEVATVPQDELWMIDFVRVSTPTSTTPVRAFLCMDTPDFDVMGTSTGEYDTADQNAPIHAPGGSLVLIVWKDMPDGVIGRAYIQWTVLRQVVSQ